MSQPDPTPALAESDDDRCRAYLDGELTEADARAFEAEMARDPALRAEVDGMRSLLQITARMADIQAPPGFYERLDRRIRQRQWVEGDWLAGGVLSLSFQVVSILVLLAVAVATMMLQLDNERGGRLERKVPPPVTDDAIDPDSGEPEPSRPDAKPPAAPPEGSEPTG